VIHVTVVVVSLDALAAVTSVKGNPELHSINIKIRLGLIREAKANFYLFSRSSQKLLLNQ